MKTLRELGIEPSAALLDYLEYSANEPREMALRLTPRKAVIWEIAHEIPKSLFAFEELLAHYGGKIVFEGESDEDQNQEI